MANPADPSDEKNWTGGYYELSIKLGGYDDGRLDAALKALWDVAGLSPAFRRDSTGPASEVTPVSAESVLAGRLGSTASIPGLGSTLCSVSVVREENYESDVVQYEADWLDLSLPLSALCDLDHRVGGYPFGDMAPSRVWREPIEQWFEGIGRAVFGAVPFVHAVTGFEMGGTERSEVTPGRFGLFRPTDAGTLAIEPVTNW